MILCRLAFRWIFWWMIKKVWKTFVRTNMGKKKTHGACWLRPNTNTNKIKTKEKRWKISIRKQMMNERLWRFLHISGLCFFYALSTLFFFCRPTTAQKKNTHNEHSNAIRKQNGIKIARFKSIIYSSFVNCVKCCCYWFVFVEWFDPVWAWWLCAVVTHRCS